MDVFMFVNIVILWEVCLFFRHSFNKFRNEISSQVGELESIVAELNIPDAQTREGQILLFENEP